MKARSGVLPEIEAARRWMLSFGWFPEHMEQVARLAGNIFDELKSLHGLGERWRVILEAAALVHDIGWTISPQSHHKHASRLVLENPLPGFSNHQQQLVALLVRYHRKAPPRETHRRFSSLSPGDQDGIRKLASIVRIADGLDRTHQSSVVSIRCRVEADRATFQLRMRGPAPEDIAAGSKKAKLFEEVFGRRVEFEPILPAEINKRG